MKLSNFWTKSAIVNLSSQELTQIFFGRCRNGNLHHRYLYGDVLQHNYRLGSLLLLCVVQLRAALGEVWKLMEHRCLLIC